MTLSKRFCSSVANRLANFLLDHSLAGRIGKSLHSVDLAQESPSRISPPSFISKSRLGRYSYIARGAYVLNTTIGRFCSIGANFTSGAGVHPLDWISTSPAFYSMQKQAGGTLTETSRTFDNLPVNIGSDVFIGSGVTVLDGVSIGHGAVVGAGALVTKNVAPFEIVAGVPARHLRMRFDDRLQIRLLESRWWDEDPEVLRVLAPWSSEPLEFLQRLENYYNEPR
jgi:virginiamycin A acetyltransferase